MICLATRSLHLISTLTDCNTSRPNLNFTQFASARTKTRPSISTQSLGSSDFCVAHLARPTARFAPRRARRCWARHRCPRRTRAAARMLQRLQLRAHKGLRGSHGAGHLDSLAPAGIESKAKSIESKTTTAQVVTLLLVAGALWL